MNKTFIAVFLLFTLSSCENMDKTCKDDEKKLYSIFYNNEFEGAKDITYYKQMDVLYNNFAELLKSGDVPEARLIFNDNRIHVGQLLNMSFMNDDLLLAEFFMNLGVSPFDGGKDYSTPILHVIISRDWNELDLIKKSQFKNHKNILDVEAFFEKCPAR